MDHLNLAPLTPFGAAPVRIATSTNPGCTDPASQTFAPAPTDSAISQTGRSSMAITSNGEMQHKNQHLGNATSGTVLVSAGSGAVVQAQGEGGQFLDKRKTVRAETTGRGLPKNIHAGTRNHMHLIPPTIAASTPPAVDVTAGVTHPGTLPTNVFIR